VLSTAPITVAFRDVATLFDTCELGPDFNLHGSLTINLRRQAHRFAITVNLARLALVGPFLLTTAGGGRALGVAQFQPSDAAAAPQQCASGGISSASLVASFNTVAALVGTREASRSSTPSKRRVARTRRCQVQAPKRHRHVPKHRSC
jgi:hypothetical protein